MNVHTPERFEGESPEDYRLRRSASRRLSRALQRPHTPRQEPMRMKPVALAVRMASAHGLYAADWIEPPYVL